VRAGNRSIAHDTIKKLVKLPNWGFNQLHCDVLGDNDKLEKFVKASVTKKCNTNKDITPLHCACINPNGKFLKQLLDVSPEINNID
jgi:ankyrin repeat protein